ncbi:MAG: peptidylprolyl isomerase, partial [Clostridium sp.]|nr:peptidylprolyl isomerase [Clostridium sp.]
WQQYFIDAAITNWHRYQVLNALAEAEGFTADLSEMETLRQELEAAAVQYGFENVDAMIQHDMGAGCDIDSYISYISLTESVNQYVSHLYENWEPTLEDLESYYSANEESFIQGGLSKDSGPIVDVRHILIMPKGEAVDGTYTEAQWADALKEAERILALWESGEKTEESFAALANEYSEDGGSKANGGLYQGITPDASFVENFLNWSVDESRTTGDTGIVETEFGYHIMYFVTGEPIWMTAARDNYLPYKLNLVIEENMDRWPLEVTYRNIIVTDANVSE